MRCINGAWLPDDESDAAMVHGGFRYQDHKLRAALKYVRNHRRALDIGAHCGLWSMQLWPLFERVECFEPLPRHIECWKKNMFKKLSCNLHEMALGADDDLVGIEIVHGLSGRSFVKGSGDIRMGKLDDFHFQDVDFIKLDVEGFEYMVIRGGHRTITRCKPVMVVEQKPLHARKYGLTDLEAVEMLEAMGMKRKESISGDYIMAWE